MSLRIESLEAELMAAEIAATTGESVAEAVVRALREKLERERRKAQDAEAAVQKAMEIGRHFCSLPVLDPRSADELLPYDGHGLPC